MTQNERGYETAISNFQNLDFSAEKLFFQIFVSLKKKKNIMCNRSNTENTQCVNSITYGVKWLRKSTELRKMYKFRIYNIPYKPTYTIIQLKMRFTAVF